MTISRRSFFGLLGAAGLVTVVGSIVRAASQPEASYVKAVVRDRLSYLEYADDVLDEFAADFVRLNPAMNATRGKLIAFPGLRMGRVLGNLAGAGWADRVDAFEEKIAGDFLMATDFFDEGADPSRPLNYVVFPDPYESACRNPVAVIS
ncbi:hypothetical protein [Tropicimonas marinistellae]|uniref:hypothetical protein n=1 Tax=Tropicimonas marinistellae TaxID=1739787 RepID=UPI00082CE953|nr:hypothetical protein [Tropicimonas marinistellae]